jgi:hypothetical protein
MLSDLFQKSLSKGIKMAVGGGPLFGGSASRTQVRNFFYRTNIFLTVLRIRIRMDPHYFGKLDPDPHQSRKLDQYLDPHQSEKQDPDPQISEKVEALEVHFGALKVPNLEKSNW